MTRTLQTQKIAREYAQARLFEWGNCVRRVTMSGAPRANIYSRQPFSNERMNFDMKSTEQELFAGKVWDRAIEVDELLLPVRESNDAAWRALVIRYIIREHGGIRRVSQEIQLIQFYHSTGLGKVTYYKMLRRAEQSLAMGLGV